MCYITDKDAGVVGKASRGSRRRQTVCRVQSASCMMPWGLPSARSTLRMDGDEDRSCNNAGSRPTSLNDQVLLTTGCYPAARSARPEWSASTSPIDNSNEEDVIAGTSLSWATSSAGETSVDLSRYSQPVDVASGIVALKIPPIILSMQVFCARVAPVKRWTYCICDGIHKQWHRQLEANREPRSSSSVVFAVEQPGVLQPNVLTSSGNRSSTTDCAKHAHNVRGYLSELLKG